jgi:sterol desaturase/sphingolipid hydroxylase (fatty acid hydroxylase superfamily)
MPPRSKSASRSTPFVVPTKKSDDASSGRSRAWGFLSNLAGAQDGKFFNIVPDHVDRSLRPGESILPKPTLRGWLLSALSLAHVWASPNTVWSAIALAMYFLVPFDLSSTGAAAKAAISAEFFLQRFPLWFCVTFGYTGFFHASLYSGLVDWAKRGFIRDRTYRWGKTLHNCFWSLSGVAIWVVFENVFCHLWATGRLAYMPDTEVFGPQATWWGVARFLAGLALIPLWRDSHFYFAHRLLHVKGIYKQVHALHHRNTDIEPFAGLSMHPVEHLYYYACILPNLIPALVFFSSPFHLLWNGAHLLLAPGASHSGFEDHFQADAFHYMHHRYFECVAAFRRGATRARARFHAALTPFPRAR